VGDPLVGSIVGVFEFTASRFRTRLDGLTDAELRWEPVEGCATVREDASGTWSLDRGEAAEGRVTTIAWRLNHLACHVLGGFASWLRDGATPYDGDPEVLHTASGALAALDRNWQRWHEGMERCDDARWLAPIGDAFGEHRDASTADLALHVLDEYVHHAAEVSLLRDLYAARGS
jgi:DinB superfamily